MYIYKYNPDFYKYDISVYVNDEFVEPVIQVEGKDYALVDLKAYLEDYGKEGYEFSYAVDGKAVANFPVGGMAMIENIDSDVRIDITVTAPSVTNGNATLIVEDNDATAQSISPFANEYTFYVDLPTARDARDGAYVVSYTETVEINGVEVYTRNLADVPAAWINATTGSVTNSPVRDMNMGEKFVVIVSNVEVTLAEQEPEAPYFTLTLSGDFAGAQVWKADGVTPIEGTEIATGMNYPVIDDDKNGTETVIISGVTIPANAKPSFTEGNASVTVNGDGTLTVTMTGNATLSTIPTEEPVDTTYTLTLKGELNNATAVNGDGALEYEDTTENFVTTRTYEVPMNNATVRLSDSIGAGHLTNGQLVFDVDGDYVGMVSNGYVEFTMTGDMTLDYADVKTVYKTIVPGDDVEVLKVVDGNNDPLEYYKDKEGRYYVTESSPANNVVVKTTEADAVIFVANADTDSRTINFAAGDDQVVTGTKADKGATLNGPFGKVGSVDTIYVYAASAIIRTDDVTMSSNDGSFTTPTNGQKVYYKVGEILTVGVNKGTATGVIEVTADGEKFGEDVSGDNYVVGTEDVSLVKAVKLTYDDSIEVKIGADVVPSGNYVLTNQGAGFVTATTSKLTVISVADGDVSANAVYNGETGTANITLKAAAELNVEAGVALEWIPEDDRFGPEELVPDTAGSNTTIYIVVDPATELRATETTNGVTVTVNGDSMDGVEYAGTQAVFNVDGSAAVIDVNIDN